VRTSGILGASMVSFDIWAGTGQPTSFYSIPFYSSL
jgi:hypothetical protein